MKKINKLKYHKMIKFYILTKDQVFKKNKTKKIYNYKNKNNRKNYRNFFKNSNKQQKNAQFYKIHFNNTRILLKT